MRRFLVLSVCLLMAAGVFAQPVLSGYQSYSYSHGVLTVKAANGIIEAEPYTATCIRITYKKHASDRVVSYSTIGKSAHPKTRIKETADEVILNTISLELVVSKKSLSIDFVKNGEKLTNAYNYFLSDTSKSLNFQLTDDEIYGGGSKGVDFDRRNKVLQNYNQAHYGYRYGQIDLNISIPLLISSKMYALYFDNYGKGYFDIGHSYSNTLTFGTTSGLMSFFFISGNSYDALLNQYTNLTGKQPLPPRWALGYIQSRYGYRSAKQVLNVVDSTRKAGIPLDAMVLDLFWYGNEKVMGNHNFDPKTFPHPVQLMRTLKAKGVKLIPISETFITRKSENYAYAQKHDLLTHGLTNDPYILKSFWAGPSALLDIFKPQAQQFYWNFYRQRMKEGVAGWWFDLGEPESHPDTMRHVLGKANDVHNIYALTWAKSLYTNMQREFPQRRVFNLIRSGYAGMQRYSVFPWSGDISRSWEGFRAQIPVILGMGFSGVGYMHFDAGGFTGDLHDPELYTRWLEMAAFVPVMRAHGAGIPPEPIYWDDQTRGIVTEYIKLRYRFLPYNYSLSYLNTKTGRPLVLPINYFETNNYQLRPDVNDEYLWGKDVLVAPVINKGDTLKKVIFPKGKWISWWDSKAYHDSAIVSAPLERLPLFVKAGSFVPLIDEISHTELYNGKVLTVICTEAEAGQQNAFEWYYDDGKDPKALQQGRYKLMRFSSSVVNGKQQIVLTPVHWKRGATQQLNLVIQYRKADRIKVSRKIWYTAINLEPTGEVAGQQHTTNISIRWDGRPLKIWY